MNKEWLLEGASQSPTHPEKILPFGLGDTYNISGKELVLILLLGDIYFKPKTGLEFKPFVELYYFSIKLTMKIFLINSCHKLTI